MGHSSTPNEAIRLASAVERFWVICYEHNPKDEGIEDQAKQRAKGKLAGIPYLAARRAGNAIRRQEIKKAVCPFDRQAIQVATYCNKVLGAELEYDDALLPIGNHEKTTASVVSHAQGHNTVFFLSEAVVKSLARDLNVEGKVPATTTGEALHFKALGNGAWTITRCESERVLITGGTGHLGAAMTTRAVETGHRVVTSSRDKRSLEEKFGPATPSLQYGIYDGADDEKIRKLVADAVDFMGGINHVITCAGITDMTPLNNLTRETLLNLVNVHGGGALTLMKAVLPEVEKLGGKIDGIQSSSELRSNHDYAGYVTAKKTETALMTAIASGFEFIEQAAKLAQSRGVRYTMYHTSAVNTGLHSEKGTEAASKMIQPPHLAELVFDIASKPRNLVIQDVLVLCKPENVWKSQQRLVGI